MKNLQSTKLWIFDLDNTLYSGKTKVFEQVDKKMSKYISTKLNVSIEKAKKRAGQLIESAIEDLSMNNMQKTDKLVSIANDLGERRN